MFGLLNINKPAGITSRDAVNRVQRLLRGEKIGHAGTLDPLATGVLVICLGPATRLVEYLQQRPKRYVATFWLGRDSDTEDIQGTVVELDAPPRPTAEQLAAVLPGFVGQIEQMPPAFSALKVAGKRAYDLARQGQSVQLQARTIEIHELQVLSYAYPELRLAVTCGSGTYIRSLGRDIARALGTAAVMAALERTAIGGFRVAEAHQLDDVTRETLAACVLPARLAVAHLPQIEIDDHERSRLALGQGIADRWQAPGREIAALDAAGNLIALLAPHESKELRPAKVFQVTYP